MTSSGPGLFHLPAVETSAPRLSVVVPCFNEEQVLPEFYRRTSGACAALGCSYEIVFVNDGSTDGTWQVMTAMAGLDPHVVAISLSRNHGHQLALSAGLSFCRGERILIIDADLQDPPELVEAMWARMDAGAEVVYGQRRQRRGESRFKVWTARWFYALMGWLSDQPIPRDTGDFRLVSRKVVDALASMPERHRFIRGLVSWVGFRQEPILYDREPRAAGTTKYPFTKMLRFAADAVTGFSMKPLRIASVLGLASAALGLVFVAYSLVSWTVGGTVHGWTSLMAAIALLGSAQLLVLGIIGEYLGRLYQEAKGRPLFIVESVVTAAVLEERARSQTARAATAPEARGARL
jgi:polyisoprenyl-phosphate glycosyltransferase